MSVSRNVFNEFRPFFRLFDDIARSAATRPLAPFASFPDPFDFPTPSAQWIRQPSINFKEEGNEYLVEAEMPGVKKENLEVRVGEGGKTLTIEGKVYSKATNNVPDVQAKKAETTPSTGEQPTTSNVNTAEVAQNPSSEVSDIPSATTREFSSHFTRTIQLPRAVNASGVTGHLEDGILTLRIPKAEEPGVVKVQIQ
ncbi:hypothetical protein M422DRAFT_238795 [Sphaerobolus stellatus SS14]|nr:hypothetical protein M422DRAFT_238795 [Sphaerobolus stellatus SS14]